jgi:3-oxoacyl-[acyl-carrier protein] reductase
MYCRRLAKRGEILGIVNNVGIAKQELFDSTTFAGFSAKMELNIQALLPAMRNARFGRIVNVSSLATRGFPFRSSYAAVKSALESLTRTMSVELARDGITENAVAYAPSGS